MRFRIEDFRPNLSLRSKMLIGGILILLVPMTVIGSVTFIKSSRTLKSIYEMELAQVAESLAGMVRIALEKDLKILSALASDPLIIEDALSAAERARDLVTHILAFSCKTKVEKEPISFVRKPVTTFELSHALRQALAHDEAMAG